MHPVLAKLSAVRRHELFDNPFFAPLSEPRKAQLLDAVLKLRAALDHQDTHFVVNYAAARSANAAELKGAITKTLDILDGPLGPEIVEGLWPYYPEGYYDPNPWAHPPDPFYDPEHEEHVCKETLRRILWVIENLDAADPRAWPLRLRRKAREAYTLRAVLICNFRIKVTMETPTPVRPNHGLDLIGLLADPPSSADGILKHLKRKSLRR
jgi:hypothetical protein